MLLYLFTFLAGIVTVLSPCILPILPVVISSSSQPGKYRPLGVVIGLTGSFAVFTLSLSLLLDFFGLSATALRGIAIIMIALFGLVMIFPTLSHQFAKATSSLANIGLGLEPAQTNGFFSGILLGIALGLVWTPCAGPILAAITLLIATHKISLDLILLTLMFCIGAALPLLLIAYGGRKIILSVPILSRFSEQIRKLFGLIMVITAFALYYDFDFISQSYVLDFTPLIQFENNTWVEKELSRLRSSSPFTEYDQIEFGNGRELPKMGSAPEISTPSDWLNSQPLSITQLNGKVVLIDFWTYSCINCLRTLPHLRDWYQKYKDFGFVIIGVHSPEFEFEKEAKNVKAAIQRYQIEYPVVLDNQFSTWQAYHNAYWPSHYLIDQDGVIRYVHFGEGSYIKTENAIRELLGLSPIPNKEIPKSARLITPEIYLGYGRAENYPESMTIYPNQWEQYQYTPPLQKDTVGLSGVWKMTKEKITSGSPSSELSLNFSAGTVFLVMESESLRKVKVLLDGKPLPKQFYTSDINSEGEIAVQFPRKYDLLNLGDINEQRTLTLQIPEGVSAYAFTFGSSDP